MVSINGTGCSGNIHKSMTKKVRERWLVAFHSRRFTRYSSFHEHAFAVDIADLQVAQFSASQAGCIQHHQHGAVHQVLRGSNEPRHFLLAQYCRQPPLTLGKRNVIGKIRPSECLDEEKTQSSGTTFDRSWRELAVAKQVNLILANMFWAEAIGRTVEVPREIFYRVNVGTDSVLSVVATLELVQHQLPKMGHSISL